MGHSLFAKEAPADALHLVNDHGKLFTVEVTTTGAHGTTPCPWAACT
jgi:hypothetical protein